MQNRNKASYTLWILAAVYLLYLSYKMVRDFLQGEEDIPPWMLIFVAIFVVLSVFLLVYSFKKMKLLKEEEQNAQEEAVEEQILSEPEPEEKKPLSIRDRAGLVSTIQMSEDTEDEEEGS